MIDGERRFTVCAQGRVHTNIAYLPAQYRQYIRLAGRELAAVDICTSQPLILALLLAGKARNQQDIRLIPSRSNPTAVLAPSSDSSLSEFLHDCLDGSVYDRVVAATGRYTRDEVKTMFLAVVYGYLEHMHTIVGEAVRKLYLALFNAIVELNYKLGHGGLPRLMQTIESRVMIGRVAGRLVRERPYMPLLTVHDSVVAPSEHLGAVEAVIAEEWVSEFGLAPRTKTSLFTAPQTPRNRTKRRSCGRTEGPHIVAAPPSRQSLLGNLRWYFRDSMTSETPRTPGIQGLSEPMAVCKATQTMRNSA